MKKIVIFSMIMMLLVSSITISCNGQSTSVSNTEANVVTHAQIDAQIAELVRRQEDAHGMAEYARTLGFPEDDYIILSAKSIWKESQNKIDTLNSSRPWYTDTELLIVAAMIWYESGSNSITDRHQQLTAMVPINRLNNGWDISLWEIITNRSQYSCANSVCNNYDTLETKLDSEYGPEVYDRCINNAWLALNGYVECPQNVVYQGEGKQGIGTYERCHSGYSTTYFCYG